MDERKTKTGFNRLRYSLKTHPVLKLEIIQVLKKIVEDNVSYTEQLFDYVNNLIRYVRVCPELNYIKIICIDIIDIDIDFVFLWLILFKTPLFSDFLDLVVVYRRS